jgi:two-component system NarL family response regulator
MRDVLLPNPVFSAEILGMAAIKTITVLVVDDHALIRAALVSVLNSTDDLRVVAEASNGADAVELAHKHSPAVVVLDVEMPGVDAFHAASHILQLRPNTAIMFLTGHAHDRAIEQAIKVGALGFVVKNDDPSAIPAAIRAVARGEQYFSPTVAERVKGSLADIRKRKITGTRGATLSEREVEVLRYVGKGFAKKQIAEMLGISVKTVDKHVTSVMEKLDIHDRVELALYAVREKFITA